MNGQIGAFASGVFLRGLMGELGTSKVDQIFAYIGNSGVCA